MRERDYYVIEECDGRKIIRYLGFFYPSDSETEDCWRHLEVSHEGTPLDEAIVDVSDWVSFTCSEDGKSIGDLTEGEAEELAAEYFNGEPGTRLGLKSLTLDTPCGNYWSED